MNIKSISATVLILISAFAALAFDGDRDDIEFYLSTNRIYSPDEAGIAVEFGGRTERRVTVSLRAYRIEDPVEFFMKQTNPHSPTVTSGDQKKIDPNDLKKFRSVASWEHKIKSRNDYWQNESISVPVKEKGVYLVEATVKGKTASTVLVITELGMIVKQSNSDLLAFVVNRKTGAKITGIPVTFSRSGSKSAMVRTGSDGVARTATSALSQRKGAPVNDGSDDENSYYSQMVVLGEKDGNFVISDSYYYSNYGNRNNTMQVYLHTDRPVYRPSQTVHYRAIARRIEKDGTYRNISDSTVYIDVLDARGTSIKKDTLHLSDLGTFNGSLDLADEPPLGNYTVNTTLAGTSFPFTFAVEEYKKPEYEVNISTDKAHYTRGDRITANVKADYYFGSPVAEGQVQYYIYRARYWRPWWIGSEWAYLYQSEESDNTYGQQMIHSGNGKLKSDGTMTIEYTTDREGSEDYVYRIQANVVDNSRRSITGMSSVKVTRGEYYITARTAKYVYKPGDDVTMIAKVSAFDGDRGIATGVDFKVTRSWWENDNGRYSDRREAVTFETRATTGSNGEGEARFKPEKSGYYTIVATARDSRGNDVSASSSVYITDGSMANWYYGQAEGVQIIPDKDIYKPGETMTALLILPASNTDALITTEGATVYGHQVEHLSSTSAIVRIPIEERLAPVFFLNASTMSGERFYNQSQRIAVAPEGKIIKLDVQPDKKTYRPGDKGSVTVRALDSRGNPVANTDIALAVVDEALYAIRPDATPEIEKFFYGTRFNQVTTSTSLNFYFYNYGQRNQATLASSRASGAGDALMAADDERRDAPAMKAMFDKDASREESGLVQPAIRSDFKDLMFWTPSVRTDANGYARLDVSFPDNLTTWRITARGVTAATAVGQSQVEVIARKDLLVRMETPRFITEGDELVIATTVHNYLKSEKSTRVVFTAEGVNATEREQTVMIPAGGEKRIDWKIKAPKIGEAKMTVKALTNEESDAMEMKVPVLPLGVLTGTSAIADVESASGEGSMILTLPRNAEMKTAEMTVKLSPSVSSSILGALDELVGYPYGCVEQTMSRFLPTVVVAEALEKVDVPFDAKKRAELPKMAAKGLNRLYELQHDDGGWGWWENDETNPFMTAYVLYGMKTAKLAGYPVRENAFNNGTAALRRLIEAKSGREGRGGELTTEAYMLYVAAYIHKGRPDKLYRERIKSLADEDAINNYGLALLTMAALYQGDKDLAGRYADRLSYNAQQSETGAYWSGRSWHYNWQDDQVETSAFAVKALLETQGENDLVKKGIRWLLSQKKGDAWHNTRQTAMVVYALVDYVKSTKELDPNYTAVVKVNGREIYSKRITRADIFNQEIAVKVDRGLLKEGENRVTIEKQGQGKLYATGRLNYYATGPAIKASDAGFKVTREYSVLRRKLQGGEYVYTKEPFKGTVKSGDEILVKVHITPSSRYEYFMLEDPLPAGCEVITKTDGYKIPGEATYTGGNQNQYEGYYRRYWNWWYADRDVRDEKVSFFATTMEQRTYEFSYIMRAQIPGTYSVMPSAGMLMYYPEVRGNSDAIAMNITE